MIIAVQCSWCKLYKWADGTWRQELELITNPDMISHSICPECRASFMGELRAIERSNKRPDESGGADETP